MSDNDSDLRVVTEIPDEPSMEGFKHSVGFWEGIEIAQAEVERGETIPIEQVLKEMEEWVHR